MKKFFVNFYYEEVGTIEVTANSKEEAEKQVMDILETDGTDGLKFNCIHRDYNVTGVNDE